MSRLTRDGTAEPVSRDRILRHVRGQGNIHFPCSADHEQDWQLYPVDPYSAICDDHTHIQVLICTTYLFKYIQFPLRPYLNFPCVASHQIISTKMNLTYILIQVKFI